MDAGVYMLMQKPVYQALLFLLVTPVLILVIRPKTADTAWLIAVCIFAVFLIVNAGLLWFDDRPWRYFFFSLGAALVYMAIVAMAMPGVLRVLRLDGSEEGAMAFLILIYQPVALLLVMVAKWAVTKWL